MTFAYDAMKMEIIVWKHLFRKHIAKEDLAQLKKHYKELKIRGKILVQDTWVVNLKLYEIFLKRIWKQNLRLHKKRMVRETLFFSSEKQHTVFSENLEVFVSMLVRYSLPTVISKIQKYDTKEKKILRGELSEHCGENISFELRKEGEFIPGSELTKFSQKWDIFQAKRWLLTEKDIDDEFLNAFIEKIENGW